MYVNVAGRTVRLKLTSMDVTSLLNLEREAGLRESGEAREGEGASERERERERSGRERERDARVVSGGCSYCWCKQRRRSHSGGERLDGAAEGHCCRADACRRPGGKPPLAGYRWLLYQRVQSALRELHQLSLLIKHSRSLTQPSPVLPLLATTQQTQLRGKRPQKSLSRSLPSLLPQPPPKPGFHKLGLRGFSFSPEEMRSFQETPGPCMYAQSSTCTVPLLPGCLVLVKGMPVALLYKAKQGQEQSRDTVCLKKGRLKEHQPEVVWGCSSVACNLSAMHLDS